MYVCIYCTLYVCSFAHGDMHSSNTTITCSWRSAAVQLWTEGQKAWGQFSSMPACVREWMHVCTVLAPVHKVCERLQDVAVT